MKNIFKTSIIVLALCGHIEIGYAQTASILPPAKTTFFDNNGKPLASGKIDFYIPGTTTRKTTWQDAGETVPNTNPVSLDNSGRALILGDGSYRQVVKDKYGNIIWDQVTSSTGSGGGGGGTPTVGDGDVVGTIKPYGGMVAPYGYVFAYGQEFVRASYPEAFAALTSQQNVTCTSGSPTINVSSTEQLPIGSNIESSCLNSGSIIVSKTTSTVTASSNAIISATTSARFFPYGNGDGSLTFNLPDLRGKTLIGRNNMGGIAASTMTATYYGVSPDALGANGGNKSHNILQTEIPVYNLNPTFTNATYDTTGWQITNSTAITYGGASGPINVPTAFNGGTVTLHNSVSAVIPSGGSGNAMTLVQPSETTNYVIKVIPDSNPNTFFGVASIGGMDGVIACGTGLTCAGNTISAINAVLNPPSPTILGGVFSKTCPSSNWFSSVDLTGAFACSQPNFSDISGVATVAQGGTGQTSFTANLPLIGNGSSPIAQGTVSGNTTKFATVSGTLSNGNCLTADASGNVSDAGAPCSASSTSPFYVADRTALKGLNTSNITSAYLEETGRQGIFTWTTGNFTTAIATDTNEGIYIKANAVAASSGAWVRSFDFQNYWTKWFGAIADYSTDNTAIVNSATAVANIQNTNASVGRQTATYIHVEGGVKFATQNLTMLPAANWVFVYVKYWGNSNLTPGQNFGEGTNEEHTFSVNSGFPNDATGGWVAEQIFSGPLHPAIGVNIDKAVDSSVMVHTPVANQTIQPNASNPARASVAFIRDENVERFRVMFQHYGTVSTTNGTFFYSTNRTTQIGCSGCNGSGAWGANIPVVGDVVRDVTTGGRYVVTSLATANALQTDWLSGAAAPGDILMRERAIFMGSVTGNTLTVTSVQQGTLAVGQRVVGMLANSGIVVGSDITAFGTGTGGVGTYSLGATSPATPTTQFVSGNVAANGIFGGGVVNTDTTVYPMMISLSGQLLLNDTAMIRTSQSLNNGAGSSTATMTNAPVAGNPTKWVTIVDNGVVRHIPAW